MIFQASNWDSNLTDDVVAAAEVVVLLSQRSSLESPGSFDETPGEKVVVSWAKMG